jgi:hypothetical protein
MLIIKCIVADVCSNDIGLGAVFATVLYGRTSITVRDYYLILVGKALRPEKSASWAPWEKSSSRWVRLGQRWDSSCSTCTVYSRPHKSIFFIFYFQISPTKGRKQLVTDGKI